jgi:hypothetical protein
MKTVVTVFAALVWLGICSSVVDAASLPLPAPEGDRPGIKESAVRQPRKQLKEPPAEQQSPTRKDVRPALKSSPPFKPLPNDPRRKMDDSMAPVN